MSRPRLSELEISGETIGGTKRPRLSRLLIAGTLSAANKRPRLGRLVISGERDEYRPRLSDLTITGTVLTQLIAAAGPNQTVEPGVLVTVDAEAAGSSGDNRTYQWEIIDGGAGLTLSSTTGARTNLVTPYDPAGREIVLQLTVTTVDGSAQDTVTITVRPHQLWFLTGTGVFVPVRSPFLQV